MLEMESCPILKLFKINKNIIKNIPELQVNPAVAVAPESSPLSSRPKRKSRMMAEEFLRKTMTKENVTDNHSEG